MKNKQAIERRCKCYHHLVTTRSHLSLFKPVSSSIRTRCYRSAHCSDWGRSVSVEFVWESEDNLGYVRRGSRRRCKTLRLRWVWYRTLKRPALSKYYLGSNTQSGGRPSNKDYSIQLNLFSVYLVKYETYHARTSREPLV